jgi:hypothetical protein
MFYKYDEGSPFLQKIILPKCFFYFGPLKVFQGAKTMKGKENLTKMIQMQLKYFNGALVFGTLVVENH